MLSPAGGGGSTTSSTVTDLPTAVASGPFAFEAKRLTAYVASGGVGVDRVLLRRRLAVPERPGPRGRGLGRAVGERRRQAVDDDVERAGRDGTRRRWRLARDRDDLDQDLVARRDVL